MQHHEEFKRIELPEPTLRRLPWYLAYVNMLRNNKTEYVSSTQIARELNVDSAKIAKDFSFLNIKGKTRIGYEVDLLARELTDFLGFRVEHPTFIMGVGSLGAALIQDSGLSQYGMNIVAGFDVNPLRIGTSICGVPIFDASEIGMRQKEYHAEIAILAVPVDSAQKATDVLIAGGIKAIWNFTPSRIRVPEGIVLQNTSIYSHLAVMYNRLNAISDK